ncbi:general transcription factor II-I repeat domain-containing protein 2A-like [Tachypleus tridentatus]|uniref:general transcription factor II-I repeat domain-containing protein 2A-like n=1 Tax=Tachypleus tridentatus TaxID=6853 RepID=UPI003FD33A44
MEKICGQEKKQDMKKRRNLFVKRSCESLAMLEASYEIAFVLAKKHKPFSDGKYIVKPCLQKFAKCLGDKSIERKVNEIALSKQTITRCIEELSHDVFEQLRERVHACSFFSLALDESADICDVAQLSIFIRGIDDNFNIFEELIGLESLHGKTRESDIFEKVKSCLENQHLNFSKLLSVCTDGAPSMIGRVAGTVALLGKFLGRPLLKYHCIIHQESLCVKILNLQHVMIPVVKCVNKIRAKGLNRREFREYCEVLDMEYGDLILHCELENKDLSQFPHLKEQSECVFCKFGIILNIEKIILLQEVFDSHFSDFAKEEDCMLTFTNPFSLTEQNILKMPSNIQMELIDLKANSVLKSKFNELPSLK